MGGHRDRPPIVASGVTRTGRAREHAGAAPRFSFGTVALRPGIPSFAFDVQPGEIVGVAGVEGSGKDDLLRSCAGLPDSVGPSVVSVDGIAVWRAQRPLLERGVAYLSGDRQKEGVLPRLSIAENLALSRRVVGRSILSFVSWPEEQTRAERVRRELGVRTASVDAPLASLSGGNQQKVLLGRVLEIEPRLLLLDNVTRGVDVGTRENIYDLFSDSPATGRRSFSRATTSRNSSRSPTGSSSCATAPSRTSSTTPVAGWSPLTSSLGWSSTPGTPPKPHHAGKEGHDTARSLRAPDITFEGTGHFRVEKTPDRWWFVDPDGNAFLMIGVAHADDSDLKYPHNVEIWRDTYGGSKERWIREGVVPDLKSWGFNTIGWTQEYVGGGWREAFDWAERITVQQSTSQWSPRDFQVADVPYVVLMRVDCRPRTGTATHCSPTCGRWTSKTTSTT